jgi:exodeoxyribonuclease VII large subunit
MNDNEIYIYSVSEINKAIKNKLEKSFSSIWVEGEVSNFYCHNGRHLYFDLKDEDSKIRVVMFFEAKKNLVFEIEDGLHLIINGYVSVYEKRGEYQLIAYGAKPVGKGSLILAFEQLKAKLEKKGFFDPAVKKSLPVLPEKIGAITSTGGAVIRDIVSVLEKKFNNFNLIIRNVNVQGRTSTEEICDAVDDLCEFGVDVIIIARGGGSLEDLWAFNTERVAEKVFYSKIPVISAVGHETDFTICDFVADVRAATPSVAADIVIIDKNEAVSNINTAILKADKLVRNIILMGKKELNGLLNRRIFINPRESLIFNFWQERDNLRKDLINTVQMRIINLKNKMDIVIKDLQANSPVSILQKGYALLLDKKDGNVIRSINQVDVESDIDIRIKDGTLTSRILDKKYEQIG